MQLEPLARAAESLCFKCIWLWWQLWTEGSQPAEVPSAVGKVLQSGAVICSGNLLWEEGNALGTLEKGQSLPRVPCSEVSLAVWSLPCFGGWGLTVVFHCTWTSRAGCLWPVQSTVNGAAGETNSGFCGLPGKDSCLGKSVPGSLAVCPSLCHAIFGFPCSQIHIVRQRSPLSRGIFGVCFVLNIVINEPLTWCDASCLISATVSWASLGRRGQVSDGFPGGLWEGSIRMGATAKEKEWKTVLYWHLPGNILKF